MSSDRIAAALLATALLALVALATSGCGKKGDPEPPLRTIPKAVADLAAFQRGGELILRFAYPKTTTAGQALPGLDRIEIWQVAQPPAEGVESPPALDAREFAATARSLLTLTGDEIADATAGDVVTFHLPVELPDTADRPVETRWLAVRSVLGEEVSGFSNQAVAVLRVPPAPPLGLDVEGRAEGVAVSWQTVEGVEGFHVYRRSAAAREFGPPLTFAESATPFVDRSARYGERYVYAVTAVATRTPTVESAVAAAAEVDYRDRYPPPVPAGLAALPEPDRVRLVWQASDAPDLAGYHVDRRRGGAPEVWERRTAAPLTETEWVDTAVTPGATLTYRVSAVDRLGNESPPGAPATAVVP